VKYKNYYPHSSVVRGDRGDAPQARGEARRTNAPRITGVRAARGACLNAPRVRRSPHALIVCGAGRVTTR